MARMRQRVAAQSRRPQSAADAFRAFLGTDAGRGRDPLNRWDAALVFGLFGLLVAAFFVPSLGSGAVLSAPDGDVAFYMYWARGYLGEALHGLRIPLWNPHMMSGTPFLAAGQSAIFYPPNWLFAVLPTDAVLNWQMILNSWFALAAMHLFARRVGVSRWGAVVSALAFGAGGFAVLHWWQGHLVYGVAWPWIPVAAWAWVSIQDGVCRKGLQTRGSTLVGLCVLSAAIAIQLFGGHPLIAYFTLLIIGVFQVGWLVFAARMGVAPVALRGTLHLVAAVVGAAILSAVQILPTALYSAETPRAGAAGMDYFTNQSQPLSDVVTMVAPWFWGGRPGAMDYVGDYSYWEVVAWIGGAASLLAVAGFLVPSATSPLQRTCLAGLVLAWWLAFGEYGGLYKVCFRILPGMSLFRCPGRFLGIVTFFAALLAGLGSDQLVLWAQSRAPQLRTVARRGAVALAVVVSVASLLFAGGTQGGMFRGLLETRLGPQSLAELTPAAAQALLHLGLRSSAVAATCSAAVALSLWLCRTPRWLPAGRLAICLLVVGELTMYASPYATSFKPSSMEWPLAISSVVRSDAPLHRFGSARAPTDLCQAMKSGGNHVWGYEPSVSFRYASAISMSQAYPSLIPAAWLPTSVATPLLDALAMRHVIFPPDAKPADPSWREVARQPGYALYENPAALPRAFSVAATAIVAGPEQARAAVNAKSFRPDLAVILEEPPPAGWADDVHTTPPGQAAFVTDAPERVEIEAAMQRRGWLVLMDQMLPGWSATVDGQPARLYRANAVGRAVCLGAGTHRVVMDYRAPGFAVGAVVSGFGWLCWFALIVWGIRNAEFSRPAVDKPGVRPGVPR